MEQSKFSLADVLTLLAAIIFGVISFLGINFLTVNEQEVWGMSRLGGSIMIGVVIALLFFITAFGAKTLKRTQSNFKTSFIIETMLVIFFLFFATIMILPGMPFTHFFNVMTQKQEVTESLNTSITQAEQMFSAYEEYADKREKMYERKLKSVINARQINPNSFKNYGFSSSSEVSLESQLKTKKFSIHADLFPTNYSDTISNSGIKEVALEWLQYARGTARSWHPLKIVTVVNNIESKSNKWLAQLTELSKKRQKGEKTSDFEYTLSFEENVKKHFTEAKSGSILSIGLALLLYLLMLLSWFITKRSTRFPGLKTLWGSNHTANEL